MIRWGMGWVSGHRFGHGERRLIRWLFHHPFLLLQVGSMGASRRDLIPASGKWHEAPKKTMAKRCTKQWIRRADCTRIPKNDFNTSNNAMPCCHSQWDHCLFSKQAWASSQLYCLQSMLLLSCGYEILAQNESPVDSRKALQVQSRFNIWFLNTIWQHMVLFWGTSVPVGNLKSWHVACVGHQHLAHRPPEAAPANPAPFFCAVKTEKSPDQFVADQFPDILFGQKALLSVTLWMFAAMLYEKKIQRLDSNVLEPPEPFKYQLSPDLDLLQDFNKAKSIARGCVRAQSANEAANGETAEATREARRAGGLGGLGGLGLQWRRLAIRKPCGKCRLHRLSAGSIHLWTISCGRQRSPPLPTQKHHGSGYCSVAAISFPALGSHLLYTKIMFYHKPSDSW